MAESLGEAFVEVLADTSPFGASLEEGVSSALSGIESEVKDALGDIPDIAEDAFSGVGEAASAAAEETGSAFGNVTEKIQDNIGKISLAFAGLGAASEGFARKQGETNATLGRVAAATGLADEVLRDMIVSMTDHTFSAEDAAAGMERLARAGITEAESLAAILPLMDTFADATGKSVVDSIDIFDRALSALGIPLEEAGDHMDALGFLANQTTVPLDNVAMLMRREAATLREYGMSTDDIAVAMAALEAEGVRGPRAVMAFQAALEAGEGDMRAFHRELGVGSDTLEAQRQRLAAAEGGVANFADINNAALTPIQRVQANVGNLMFRFGGLADAAGIVAAPIGALGPMMMGLNATQQLFSSGIMSKVIPAIGAKIGAFAKLSVAILTNPIFLVGALLIGLAVLIWKFRDEIIEALVGAWEWIKEATQAFWDFLKNLVSTLVETVTNFFRNLVDTVRSLFERWWSWYRGLWQRLFDLVRNIVTRIRDFVVNGFNTLRDRATSAIERMRDSVRNILNSVVDFVKDLPARVVRGLGNLGSLLFDKGRDMIQGLLDGAKSLLKNIGSFFLNIVPGWIRGPFEKALGISSPSKVFAEIGRDTMEGFSVGVDDELRRVQRTMAGMAQAIPMDLRTDEIQGSIQAGGGMVRSQEIRVEINNPAPEPASVSITREMRKLAATGVFDG